MDRSSKQNIHKETAALNDRLDQMDLIDIFRAFHPKATNYTFFSSAHGMFSRIDHMLGYKTSLNKFKKIEIISSIFSDHNAMKLEIKSQEQNWQIFNHTQQEKKEIVPQKTKSEMKEK